MLLLLPQRRCRAALLLILALLPQRRRLKVIAGKITLLLRRRCCRLETDGSLHSAVAAVVDEVDGKSERKRASRRSRGAGMTNELPSLVA